MTTAISDQGVQFAGGNIISIATTYPTSGTYTAGDIVVQSSTTGEIAGWKRLTTGANNVLNTDWIYFGPIGTGQTYSDVKTTPGRVLGTTYYNTTGRPIMAYIGFSFSATQSDVYLDGIQVGSVGSLTAGMIGSQTLTLLVRSGGNYKVGTGVNLVFWTELR